MGSGIARTGGAVADEDSVRCLPLAGSRIGQLGFLGPRSRKRQKISSQIVIYICSNPRPLGSATAIDIADMLAGWAFSKARAAAWNVAPVVVTSSTRTTCLPLIRLVLINPKAPRRFSIRWVAERCVCVSVDRVRVSAFTSGLPQRFDSTPRDQLRLVVAAGDVPREEQRHSDDHIGLGHHLLNGFLIEQSIRKKLRQAPRPVIFHPVNQRLERILEHAKPEHLLKVRHAFPFAIGARRRPRSTALRTANKRQRIRVSPGQSGRIRKVEHPLHTLRRRRRRRRGSKSRAVHASARSSP